MARNRRAEAANIDPAKQAAWAGGLVDELEDDVWTRFDKVDERFDKVDSSFIEVRLDNKDIQGKLTGVLVAALVACATFATGVVLILVKG